MTTSQIETLRDTINDALQVITNASKQINQTPDPYAELKKAHAEGKVIQRDIGFCDPSWLDCKNPDWSLPADDYRIKPEEPWTLPRQLPGFRALRDGEKWHFADKWKQEWLPEGNRPLLVGEDEMAGDECVFNDGTTSRIDLDRDTNPQSMQVPRRTKRPLPILMPDPYAELKKAHAEGKVIQFYSQQRDQWIDAEDPGFFGIVQYRIKPEEPKPILTPQQIAEGWKEWHGGENPVPGKKVIVLFRDNNQSTASHLSAAYRWRHLDSFGDIIAYRVIEPRLIPLGPKDVRCGDEVKHKEYEPIYGISIIYDSGVSVPGNSLLYFEELKDYYLIRRRNSDTFEPCSKEATHENS